MMERTFSPEELISLCVAILLHAALALVLIFQPQLKEPEPPVKPQERITVSLASEVGLTATSPDPAPVSRAALAPTVSPDPVPGVAAPEPAEVTPNPDPEPDTSDAAQEPAPTPPKDTSPRRRPDRDAAKPTPKKPPAKKKPAAKKPPAKKPPAKKPPKKAAPKKAPPKKTPPKKNPPKKGTGGSSFADAFKDGAGTANQGSSKSAAPFGPAERSALNRAITRALRPHWSAPTGLDADKLVTPVTWQLNPNGSLKGTPRCKQPRGVTDGNRAQVKRHCEAAKRAVRLAAPFKLPEQFYSRWDDLEWDFDRKL